MSMQRLRVLQLHAIERPSVDFVHYLLHGNAIIRNVANTKVFGFEPLEAQRISLNPLARVSRNFFDCSLDVAAHDVRVKSQNDQTHGSHVRVPPPIIRNGLSGFAVLHAVDLDNQTAVSTIEIGDVWAYGVLFSELDPQLTPAQAVPYGKFGRTEIVTVLARVAKVPWWDCGPLALR